MKIVFDLDNQEYTIPELTVYDWYEIQDELILNPEAGLTIVSYLSTCPIDRLREMAVEDWEELWTLTQNFITDQSRNNLFPDKQLKWNGTKYKLIDTDKITIGHFADLDILINSPGSEKKIHNIMAYLYEPVVAKEENSLEAIEDRAKQFMSVPLKDAVKSLNFFLLSGQQFLNSIRDYLTLIDKEMETPEVKEILQRIGCLLQEAGIQLSLSYQAETLPRWIPSQNLKYARLLTGLPSLKTNTKSKNYLPKKQEA